LQDSSLNCLRFHKNPALLQDFSFYITKSRQKPLANSRAAPKSRSPTVEQPQKATRQQSSSTKSRSIVGECLAKFMQLRAE